MKNIDSKISDIFTRYGRFIAALLIIIGFLVIIGFACIFPFNDWSFNLDADLLNKYGSFIGGLCGSLFSLSGFFLLYLTFSLQKDTFNLQQIKDRKSQFDSTFFTLLRTQQEIKCHIKGTFFCIEKNLFEPEEVEKEGNDFFRYANNELSKILMVSHSEQYIEYYPDKGSLEYRALEDKMEHLPIVPFMPNKPLDEFTLYVKNSYTNKLYEISEEKWNSFKDCIPAKKIAIAYKLFFDKYEYTIGFYFRHLYHILKYIKSEHQQRIEENNNTSIIEKEIGQYIDFVQSQMSSEELLLLYYNSFLFPKMRCLLEEYPSMLENLTLNYLNDDLKLYQGKIQLKNKDEQLELAIKSFN